MFILSELASAERGHCHGHHDLDQSRVQSRHRTRQKTAAAGPVFITDRGKPAHVLLIIEDYQRIMSQHRNIVEALSMPGLSDIALECPRLREIARSADFS
jgi:PHD/YefM family antitoxin component YafN of YafNO toxin-antitoxin module